MGAKIRKAQKKKIPYMLVVGDAEMEANAVALRMRDGEDRGAIPVDDFITLANNSIADRA
jgi:threonyl-tRNA synthetase